VLGVDGNILESRMTSLGSDFATMFLVNVNSQEQSQALEEALKSRFQAGNVLMKPTAASTPNYLQSRKRRLIDMAGPDTLGLLKNLTAYFASKDIFVLDMSSETVQAPFAGYHTFELQVELAIPEEMVDDTILRDLKDIEERMGIQIDYIVP